MAKKYKQRKIKPDPLYNDLKVAKFINKVMKEGKKTKAQKIVYRAFEIIKEKTKKDPLEVFFQAIDKVKPLWEVRPQRVGGATYQVPREVKEKRGVSLAMKWIIESARNKKGKQMAEKLAQELIDSVEEKSNAFRRKIQTHKMAEANRAFAHLAR